MKSLLTLTLSLLSFAATAGQQVILEWNSIDAPDCALYRLYFGTAPGVHFASNVVSAQIGIPAHRSTLTLDSGRQYYFAVDAVLSNGQASAKSAELAYVVPVPVPASLRVVSTLQAANSLEGPWTNIATLNEQIVPTVTDQLRFYRSLVSVITESPPSATPSVSK